MPKKRISVLYEVVENSFLGDLLHSGVMSIHFSRGRTQYGNEPNLKNYETTEEFTNEQFVELIKQVDENYNPREHKEVHTIDSRHMSCFYHTEEDGQVIFDMVTVYNVWEIEDLRLNSENEEEVKLAEKLSTKLRK